MCLGFADTIPQPSPKVPAPDAPIRTKPARGTALSDTYGHKCFIFGKRNCLGVMPPPASCQAVCAKSAGKSIVIANPPKGGSVSPSTASAYGHKFFYGRVSGPSPALRPAILQQTAGMSRASAYGCERTRGRRTCFAVFVIPPAYYSAVLAQRAGMRSSCAYRHDID